MAQRWVIMSFWVPIAFEARHLSYWMFKILVTQSAIHHSVLKRERMLIITFHLFQNWLGMLCKDFTIFFFPSYHATLSVQFFYVFSVLSISKKILFSSLPRALKYKRVWIELIRLTLVLISGRPWLPTPPSAPHDAFPCYLANRSKHLLTRCQEQHTGPLYRAISLHNIVCFLLP